jgi:RNA polymerase sigma-70 factor (ECF subfamily)
MRSDLEQTYRDLRPYAFAIAYRMLGSVSEAEDTVQDTFLRLAQDENSQIRSPKAYIATITTRLAIDRLRSAGARREAYIGPWLPEPVLDDPVAGPGSDAAASVELADSLSMAFLVVLETLTPPERAVFLLHDVFGYDYDEIAPMVEKSQANCRQLASRARRRVQAEQPRFTASREERDRLADLFFAACQQGDMGGIVELLARDAVLYGDGGPRGAGINRPMYGRDSVGAMLGTWFRRLTQLGIRLVRVSVNGQPGAEFFDRQGRLINVITLDIVEESVQTIRSVINPDKLGHLGDLSPLGVRKRATDRPGVAAWDSDK